MSRSSIPAKRTADAQEAAWVADEDRFVLQQTRKKAVIRAKSGRAQPIDWLNVILAVIDPDRNPVDDELDEDMEIMDPEAVFEPLTDSELVELERKIEALQTLETSRSNRDYWLMMQTVCRERRTSSETTARSTRGITSVTPDLETLFKSKTLPELEKLERQINDKLNSRQPIDTDYWQHLLQSLLVYKAKAKLKNISKSIASSRGSAFRRQQALEASALRSRLAARLEIHAASPAETSSAIPSTGSDKPASDPEPFLRLPAEDKGRTIIDSSAFEKTLEEARAKVLSLGYVTSSKLSVSTTDATSHKRQKTNDANQNLSAAFDREVARGLGDNEEIFNAEVEVQTKNRHLWANDHRPRKPQYFNRVALGFEWNKYNQTHYDQDNPPPKVVQGYKFTVFYPDLVDKTRAPRYRIERDDGRRKGEMLAPAGEDDTCVLRFFAGPPYEDLAFRIVDKEWDYSAKRDRGFKSSFDKGVLQLQFHFKKVYYRK